MDTPSRNERDIFLAAAELTAVAREDYLMSACAGDPDLASRVRDLLAAHDISRGPLDAPPPGLGEERTVDRTPPVHLGTQIGPYKLLQQIGEGGMGVVYMAEQLEPVRRRVALKIIKPGMDTRHVVARFEAERQALSLMDHPHIAKALDAGATDSGHPYFVMELVKGQPITKYCDEHQLTPRQRLELFIPVCQAVQHAHQKGIIHRDIKPSNILVAEYDQQVVPKVIDFGVAKAISQPLVDKTLFTGYGQIVGTLEYMSPEQAKLNQLDIDTRSDIYSLGVLLYELLTGTTPFEKQRLRSAAWDEMLRIIREEEPPKPSTRLSESGNSLPSISAQRRTAPAKLTRLVRGDLDWIVMKALDKDRARRYETANGLAADVLRFLNGEAVTAIPPSTTYRLRKFVLKNRRLFLTAAAIAAALLIGTVVATWQAFRATHAQHKAEQASHDQEVQRLQAEANMQLAYQALDKIYLQLVEEELPRYPERLDSYRRVLEDALGFYSQFAAKNAGDPRVKYELAVALARGGKLAALLERRDEALNLLGRAREILEPLWQQDPTQSKYRMTLALVYHELGLSNRKLDKFDAALAALNKATQLVGDPGATGAEPWVGDTFIQVGLTRGSLERQTGRFAEAERSLRQVLETGKSLLEQTHDRKNRHRLAQVATQLGSLLSDQGRHEAAEPFLAQAQELLEPLLTETPDSTFCRRSTALMYLNRGANLSRLNRNPDASALLQRGILIAEELERQFPGNPEYAAILVDLVNNLDATRSGPGNPDPDQLARTLERARRAATAFPDNPEYQLDLAMCLNNHGVNLEDSGQLTEALTVYDEALEVGERLVAKSPQATLYRDLLVRLVANLGDVYAGLGRDEEAEQAFRRAIREAEPLIDSTQQALAYRILQAEMAQRLQKLLRTLQRGDEAEQLAGSVVQQFDAMRSQDPDSLNVQFQLARAHLNHGNILNDLQRYPEALAAFDRAESVITEASRQRELTRQMINVLNLLYANRGDVHRTLENFTESETAYRESIRLLDALAQSEQDDPQRRDDLLRRISHLAELYRRSGRLTEAEPDLVRGIEIGDQLVKDFPRIASFQKQLIELMSYLTAIHLEREELRSATAQASRAWELAESAAGLASDDPQYRDLPLHYTSNALAVAQQANDLTTQHRALNRLLELTPDDPELRNSLAWLLATSPDLTLRDPARAASLAAEAVAKAPDNSDFQGTLGAALYRMGELDMAMPALAEAIRLRGPDDPVSSFNYYYLAMIQWRQGLHQEAKDSFAKAEAMAATLPDDAKRQHAEPLALLRNESLGILGPLTPGD